MLLRYDLSIKRPTGVVPRGSHPAAPIQPLIFIPRMSNLVCMQKRRHNGQLRKTFDNEVAHTAHNYMSIFLLEDRVISVWENVQLLHG